MPTTCQTCGTTESVCGDRCNDCETVETLLPAYVRRSQNGLRFVFRLASEVLLESRQAQRRTGVRR